MISRVNATRRGVQAPRSNFQYTYRSEESVRERAERQGGGRFDSPFKANVDIWRPKAGENQIRICPPTWEGQQHYAYTVYVHDYVGSENGTYLCLSKMLHRPCYICDCAKLAQDQGDEDDSKALKFKEKLACWVVDRDAEVQIPPQMYLMGWMMDRDITALTYNRRAASNRVLYIDHPDEGYDIIIRRQGEKLLTRYLPSIVPQPCPIFDDPDQQMQLMQFLEEHPIPDMLLYRDNAYLQRVMTGVQEQTDDELDQQDTSQDYDHEAAEAEQYVDEQEQAPAPRAAPRAQPAQAPARRPAAATRPARTQPAPQEPSAEAPWEDNNDEFVGEDPNAVEAEAAYDDEPLPGEEELWEEGAAEPEPAPPPRQRPAPAAQRPVGARTAAPAQRPANVPAATQRPPTRTPAPAPAQTRPAPRAATPAPATRPVTATRPAPAQRPAPATRPVAQRPAQAPTQRPTARPAPNGRGQYND